MKMNIYSIYDQASVAYMRPFFAHSDGQALRSFNDISLDAEHEIGKHPEDYSLHRIGTFDDQNASINPENPTTLATALELVAKARNVNRDNIHELERNIKVGGTD